MRIQDKEFLVIRGAGQGSTTVHFTAAVDLGFAIRSNTRSLTLRSMTIEGEVVSHDAPIVTHGIGSNSDVIGIDNILITDVEARNLGIGISVGNALDGTYRCKAGTYGGARIIRNYVHDIYGFENGGKGYGIHSACAGEVEISYNTVRNAQRHGIYQGKNIYRNPSESEDFPAGATPKIRIIGNWIIDSRHGFPDPNNHNDLQTRSALAVARSHNVSVVGNTIAGSHSRGIEVSAEYDMVPRNAQVIGNHFLVTPLQAQAPGYYDMWFNGAEVRRWGNKRNAEPGVANPSYTLVTGGVDLGEPQGWPGTQWIEEMGGDLYVMNNGVLYRLPAPPYGTEPDGWAANYSTTPWPAFSAMAAMNGSIYLVQAGQLRKIMPQLTNGSWPAASSSVSYGTGFQGMSAVDGFVYIVQNGILNKITPATNGTAWPSTTTAITSDSGYAMRGGIDALHYIRRWGYLSIYSHLSNLENIN